jgi:hypothetical protein
MWDAVLMYFSHISSRDVSIRMAEVLGQSTGIIASNSIASATVLNSHTLGILRGRAFGFRQNLFPGHGKRYMLKVSCYLIDSLMTTEDMLTNFLTLPSELRNRVYELCLLHQESLDPWTAYNQRQELTPGLLRANKTVHREASSLFYAQNRFNFTMATPDDVALFLRTIGRNNADYIRQVRVDFPNLRDPDKDLPVSCRLSEQLIKQGALV